jgi:hypothetical protein
MCGAEDSPHCKESRDGFFFSLFSTAGRRHVLGGKVERGIELIAPV